MHSELEPPQRASSCGPDFVDVLPGLIAEPERADLVMDHLKALSK